MKTSPQKDSLGFLVNDVARLLRRRFERALAQAGLGLTPGEARTLFYASRCGTVRQSVLADEMSVEPMTLVAYLDRLEQAGLICRAPDPADRRAKRVELSAAAEPVVAQIMDIAHGVREGASAGLTPADIETLRRALQVIRANLCGGEAAGEAAE